MIVLKIGGDIFKKGLKSNLLLDIKKVLENEKMVVVHGGGDEVTEIAEKLGEEQKFVTSPGGIRSRYTDKNTIDIFTMVMAGKINKTIVRWLLSAGVSAFGIAGIDGSLIKAKRKKRLVIIDQRGRKRIIEGGYTGKITFVNSTLLKMMIDNNFVPVVAPIAIGEDTEILNVDADRAAGQIAGSLRADKIIFLTDVKGVILNNRYVKTIKLSEVDRILSDVGTGMDKKLIASREALNAGTKEVIISSGFCAQPLTWAMNHIKGTVINFG
jgi:acetylglutamate/LysW-gamma-L-alpha-aminoadipate kinase